MPSTYETPLLRILRPYQQHAVDAALECARAGKHPVISLPTGAGKGIIAATLCRKLPGRILVVTHRKELISQNFEELSFFGEDAGVYSAGLKRRESEARVIFGGIQSIYRRMDELQASGAFGSIVVDEAHLCGLSTHDSMYSQLFRSCPSATRIGLSATPYRLNDGPIWGLSDTWFTDLAIEVKILELTPEYLAPLRGVLTAHDLDLTGVRKQSGEFVLSDMSQVACGDNVVDGALNELCLLGRERNHWLVFCIDVAHTEIVTEKLRSRGINASMVVGTTSDEERDDRINGFKLNKIRALVGCQVFTTGFNSPNVDLIAMLRPTQSKSLVVQMVGRGSRKHDGKQDCLILDFSGNIERHQPLDSALYDCEKSLERQTKEAREEREKKEAAAKRTRKISHGNKASLVDPFADSSSKKMTQKVKAVYFSLEKSSKFPTKKNIVVSFKLEGNPTSARAWICLEYAGGARWHAEQWFKRRGVQAPASAEEGLEVLKGLRKPVSVVVDRSEKYPRIIMEQFEESQSSCQPW